MKWAVLVAGLVGLLVAAIAYPRIYRYERERDLKDACDRSIAKAHDQALKEYAAATRQYEADMAAFELEKQRYDAEVAEFHKAETAYYSVTQETATRRRLQKPTPPPPQYPTEPTPVREPEDATSASASWLAVVSLETKAVVLGDDPDQTCAEYTKALLDDPDKAANVRWEINLMNSSAK